MTNSTAYAMPGIQERYLAKLSTFSEITESVCKIYDKNVGELTARTRKRDIVFPRQVCMTLCKLKTKHSLSSIGIYYGGFDHATVIHALKIVKNMIDTDRNIRSEIGHLFVGVKWPYLKN